MSGTKLGQFEGHMAEIMWRAEVKSNRYEGFFSLIKSVYPLNAAPQYHYTTPLFDTWTGIPNNDLGDWDIRPGNTDAESESDIMSTPGTSNSPSSSPAVFLESENSIPPNLTASDNTIRKRKEAEDQETASWHNYIPFDCNIRLRFSRTRDSIK
uniref:Uncharacterized protein LOC111113899 n=1 Tax=Crassostrea virginica TaxID=6565 RepID=A0A8B8BWZ8_CRAVI|nr:uncharacterized protein LOC111113899 [Crassostrea virginica]